MVSSGETNNSKLALFLIVHFVFLYIRLASKIADANVRYLAECVILAPADFTPSRMFVYLVLQNQPSAPRARSSRCGRGSRGHLPLHCLS